MIISEGFDIEHGMTRLLPALLLLSGCYHSVDAGPEVSDTRSLSSFSKLRVQDGLTVHFAPGSVNEVEIATQQKVLENLLTEVKDGTLNVRLKPGVRVSSLEWTDVNVTGTDVRELNASESSGIVATGLDRDALTLAASGGSRIECAGTVSALHVEASGGSTVTATAQRADLDVSGGSQISITADFISGAASGGSTITANADADLTGLIVSGGSQVTNN